VPVAMWRLGQQVRAPQAMVVVVVVVVVVEQEMVAKGGHDQVRGPPLADTEGESAAGGSKTSRGGVGVAVALAPMTTAAMAAAAMAAVAVAAVAMAAVAWTCWIPLMPAAVALYPLSLPARRCPVSVHAVATGTAA